MKVALLVAGLLMVGTQGESPEGWTMFESDEVGLRFRCPSSLLVISEEKGELTLIHRVPYRHAHPCDMSDESGFVDDIIDFEVRLSLKHETLPEVFRKSESDFVTSRFFKGGQIETSPGFIDKIQVGSLHGYRLTTGAEGCGLRRYYLRIGESRTLRVEWMNVPELIRTYRDEVLALRDLIHEDEAAMLFEGIISSCTPIN